MCSTGLEKNQDQSSIAQGNRSYFEKMFVHIRGKILKASLNSTDRCSQAVILLWAKWLSSSIDRNSLSLYTDVQNLLDQYTEDFRLHQLSWSSVWNHWKELRRSHHRVDTLNRTCQNNRPISISTASVLMLDLRLHPLVCRSFRSASSVLGVLVVVEDRWLSADHRWSLRWLHFLGQNHRRRDPSVVGPFEMREQCRFDWALPKPVVPRRAHPSDVQSSEWVWAAWQLVGDARRSVLVHSVAVPWMDGVVAVVGWQPLPQSVSRSCQQWWSFVVELDSTVPSPSNAGPLYKPRWATSPEWNRWKRRPCRSAA